jgi:sulfatase modifying factor 1
MRERLAYAVGIAVSLAVSAALLLPMYLNPPARARTARPIAPVVVPPPRPLAIDASASASAAPGDSAFAPPPKAAACPSDMLFVHGAFCPFVAHKCLERHKGSAACNVFAGEVLCEGTVREGRFCIDQLEYPNVAGTKPAVLVSYPEARHACDVEGKRLCSVDEWQFACEGEPILPLPEGLRRDGGCNVDAPDPPPLFGALHTPSELAKELMRVDGRVPAGSRTACVSSFGVGDMAGNVAEWTENPLGGDAVPPFHSAIAGGSFGAGEASCRTLDVTTPEAARSHRVGFRCCADAGPRASGEPVVPSRRSPGGFRPIPKKGSAF